MTAINPVSVVTDTSMITIGALFVATTGSDAGNLCNDTATPCATVQHAVDVANPGDEIRVASGVYTGVSARSNITQMVFLSKTVDIRGGYVPTNWLTSYPVTQTTTLDAQGKGRVFYVPSTATIEGLRITGGNATRLGGAWGDAGGGIYAAFGSPIIRQCTIVSNTAQRGGGVFLAQGYTTFTGNTVISNSATLGGGGLLAYYSSGDWLDGNVFISNTSMSGGGVYLSSGVNRNWKVRLTNNVIADNRATGNGSGLYAAGGNYGLWHTTVARNTGGDGSGIYVAGISIGLTNTIIASQTVGIYTTTGATATLESTLWPNGAWANRADWSGTGVVYSGTANVRGEPAFIDPLHGDYHIDYASAAINAGVNGSIGTDLDGEPRPFAGGYDIGADEFVAQPQLTLTTYASSDSVLNGTVLTYTLRITNTGAYDLHTVVTDTLPAHVVSGGILTWTPVISAFGATWMKEVTVTIDPGYVGILTNTVKATTAEGASGIYTKTVTAIDPPPPTVQFSDAMYSVNENSGTALITVTLSATSGQTVTVNYATTDDTATAGSDYTTTSGTLTFSPGQTVKTFSVPIINDTLNEPSETVVLTLSSWSNATPGLPNPTTLTILDDDTAPTVQFSDAMYSVNENNGAALITVTLSATSGQTVTVNYATTDDTATAGSDYTTTSGTLTFTPGQTVKTFSVPIINDTLNEPSETVVLTLSSWSNATPGLPNPTTLTILDDDTAPTVQFSDAMYSVNENNGAALITVTLSATSGQTVTVNYATTDDTATAGSDYTTTSGTLTFSPGQTVKTFSVPIINDTLNEPSETVVLTLSSLSNATPGLPNPTTLTILDDDTAPTVQFSDTMYSVNENNGAALITVTLSATSGQTVTVNYATTDDTATAGSDYTTTSGTLTFSPGQTVKTFSVPIINDTLNEPSETVVLTLSSWSNATPGLPNPTTLTILDDDTAPTVQFSDAMYSVNENSGAALITVTLSAASGQTVTVNYATTDDTATAGSDYTTTSGTLTFSPGQTVKTFSVPIINDTLNEPSETVVLTLSSLSNATPGLPNPTTLIILDDDTAPTVQFSDAMYSVNENSGAALITVTLSAASGQTVTVNYATTDDTATAGSDYTTTSGTLTFSPGQTVKTFSVPIINDTLNEPSETVVLTLSSWSNATPGLPNPTTLTILDDDTAPTVQFSDAMYSVNENNGAALITVTLSATSGQTVTVNYATTDDTATVGSDYTTTSGTLTFTPGQTVKTFSVPIINDTLNEPSETVVLTLSSWSNTTPGLPNPAILTIINKYVDYVVYIPLLRR